MPPVLKQACRLAMILLGAGLMACAGHGDRRDAVLSAYVVLGAGGQPIARVITTATSCPSIGVDGRAVAMQHAVAGRHGPFEADRVEAGAVEAQRLSGHHLRGPDTGRRAPGERRGDRAAAATRDGAADRRHRRHRVPHQGQRTMRSRIAIPSTPIRSPPSPPPPRPGSRTWSSMSAITSTARTRALPTRPRIAATPNGATASTPGRPIFSIPQRRCSAPPPG